MTSVNILVIQCGGYPRSAGAYTGATYDSVAMTQLLHGWSDGNRTTHAIYYLVNPSTGSNTITVTNTGTGVHFAGLSVSYFGVDQISPILDTQAVATAAEATSSFSKTMTTVAGAMAILALSVRDQTSSSIGTAGSGDTRINGGWSNSGAGSEQSSITWFYELASGASTNVAVTGLPTSGSDYKIYSGFALAEASGEFIAGKNSGGMFFSKTQNFYDELKRGLIPSWDVQRRYKEVYA